MYPHITCDKENGVAYIAFSDNDVEKSVASEDELFVLNIGKNREIVGIEIASMQRLQEKFVRFLCKNGDKFSPEMIAAYLMPFNGLKEDFCQA